MTETQDDGLPSKETCIRYTLAVCGCDPNDTQNLIDDMIAKRKKFKAITERRHAEATGLPKELCDKLYPKTWE